MALQRDLVFNGSSCFCLSVLGGDLVKLLGAKYVVGLTTPCGSEELFGLAELWTILLVLHFQKEEGLFLLD